MLRSNQTCDLLTKVCTNYVKTKMTINSKLIWFDYMLIIACSLYTLNGLKLNDYKHLKIQSKRLGYFDNVVLFFPFKFEQPVFWSCIPLCQICMDNFNILQKYR